jgi:hypothetical protein
MPPRADQPGNYGDLRAEPDSTNTLAALLADCGQDWQIDHQISPSAWVAMRRCQSPVVEIHYALSIDQLRAKPDRC